MIESRTVFDFDEKTAELILSSLRPDITNTKRATITLKIESETLVAEIRAKDTTALRAAINSVLRLVGAAEKVLNI